jgi:hypothetical protein
MLRSEDTRGGGVTGGVPAGAPPVAAGLGAGQHLPVSPVPRTAQRPEQSHC